MDGIPEVARLDPIPPAQWPPEMRDALAALHPPKPRHPFPESDGGRPKGLNILGTMAHHPALATAYHTFNGHILFATTLNPRQRELLILRVAHVRGCAYEWAQHEVLAGDVGLAAEELDRIRVGPDSPGWEPIDAALVRAVDELVADARLGEATWTSLSEVLDARQLMDVVFTVGAYDALAMAMLTFGLELDADLL